MPRNCYNPDIAPEAREWFSWPESERIRLAQSYHVSARVKVPGMKEHAAMHVVVENQIAMGFGPSQRAVVRLQSEGLSRHEAIHAIASVVIRFTHELLQGQTAEQQASFQSRMNEAIEHLHAQNWLSGNSGG
jgi:hypothetical protein